jgi:integrase
MATTTQSEPSARAYGTKPARRRSPRTFGAIRKLPSGFYQATYQYRGRRYTAPGTFEKRSDADDWLSEKQTEIRHGQWHDPKAGQVNFKVFAEDWLQEAEHRKPKPLRATTAAKYRGLLERHIYPTFEDQGLSEITDSDVKTWFYNLAERHESTAAGAYRLLAGIFNSAVKPPRRLLVMSPCQVPHAAEEPEPKKPEPVSVEEFHSLVAAVPEHLRAAVHLGMLGQLRRSEILGLQRRDLDLKRCCVEVERAWTVTESGVTNIGLPKTKDSARTVWLPQATVDVLKVHLKAHVGAAPSSWVFPSRDGTQPLHPRLFAVAWSKAREAIGRPDLRTHHLRHAGLTRVDQVGATRAERMRRGGHISDRAADRYSHAEDDRDRAIADALGKIIFEAD